MVTLYENGLLKDEGISLLESMIGLLPDRFSKKIKKKLHKLNPNVNPNTHYDFMTDYDKARVIASRYFVKPKWRLSSLRNLYFPYLSNEEIRGIYQILSLPVDCNLYSERRKITRSFDKLRNIKLFPIENQGLLYASAGYYLEYVKWKNSGNKLKFRWSVGGPDVYLYTHTYSLCVNNDKVVAIYDNGTSMVPHSYVYYRSINLLVGELGIPAYHPDMKYVELQSVYKQCKEFILDNNIFVNYC